MKKRIEKIKAILEKGDAALITSDLNRLYLTGFKSSAGYLLITKNKACFFIDFRYNL